MNTLTSSTSGFHTTVFNPSYLTHVKVTDPNFRGMFYDMLYKNIIPVVIVDDFCERKNDLTIVEILGMFSSYDGDIATVAMKNLGFWETVLLSYGSKGYRFVNPKARVWLPPIFEGVDMNPDKAKAFIESSLDESIDEDKEFTIFHASKLVDQWKLADHLQIPKINVDVVVVPSIEFTDKNGKKMIRYKFNPRYHASIAQDIITRETIKNILYGTTNKKSDASSYDTDSEDSNNVDEQVKALSRYLFSDDEEERSIAESSGADDENIDSDQSYVYASEEEGDDDKEETNDFIWTSCDEEEVISSYSSNDHSNDSDYENIDLYKYASSSDDIIDCGGDTLEMEYSKKAANKAAKKAAKKEAKKAKKEAEKTQDKKQYARGQAQHIYFDSDDDESSCDAWVNLGPYKKRTYSQDEGSSESTFKKQKRWFFCNKFLFYLWNSLYVRWYTPRHPKGLTA